MNGQLHESLYSPNSHPMRWNEQRQAYIGHDLEDQEVVVSAEQWQAEQEAGAPERVMQNPAHWQQQ